MAPMNNRLLVPRQTPGLLDLVPGAAAAYSLRSLSRSYAGPVVTVRRSSDDAEEDFTASEVSDGTLAAWCGAGDGYVKTWFDQSGNTRDASQTTAGYQPKIVSSGVVILEEGKPAIQFDGSDDFLTPGSYLVSGQLAVSVFAVVNVTGTSNDTVIAEYFVSGSRPLIFRQNNATTFLVLVEDSSSVDDTFTVASNAGIQKQLAFLYNSGDVTYCENGIILHQSSALTGALATSTTPFTIGARNSGLEYADAKVQEVVVYRSDLASQRSLIEGNIAWSYS